MRIWLIQWISIDNRYCHNVCVQLALYSVDNFEQFWVTYYQENLFSTFSSFLNNIVNKWVDNAFWEKSDFPWSYLTGDPLSCSFCRARTAICTLPLHSHWPFTDQHHSHLFLPPHHHHHTTTSTATTATTQVRGVPHSQWPATQCKKPILTLESLPGHRSLITVFTSASGLELG